jgi:hypothetical protein
MNHITGSFVTRNPLLRDDLWHKSNDPRNKYPWGMKVEGWDLQ